MGVLVYVLVVLSLPFDVQKEFIRSHTIEIEWSCPRFEGVSVIFSMILCRTWLTISVICTFYPQTLTSCILICLFRHPFQVQSKKEQPVEEEEEEEEANSIRSSESVGENKEQGPRNSSACDEEDTDQELEREPLSQTFLCNRQDQ